MVEITKEAQRQFEKLPVIIKVRMLEIFKRLEQWPDVSGTKPLRGPYAGQFRMRTGDYRVRFQPFGNRIVILRVGHRDKFYKDED